MADQRLSFVACHSLDLLRLVVEATRRADGVLRLTKGRWDEARMKPDLDALHAIKWRKFADNFWRLYAASSISWFSNADWETVGYNMALCARAAKAGRCKGLELDSEPVATIRGARRMPSVCAGRSARISLPWRTATAYATACCKRMPASGGQGK